MISPLRNDFILPLLNAGPIKPDIVGEKSVFFGLFEFGEKIGRIKKGFGRNTGPIWAISPKLPFFSDSYLCTHPRSLLGRHHPRTSSPNHQTVVFFHRHPIPRSFMRRGVNSRIKDATKT